MSRYIDADEIEDKAKRYSLGYYESDEWAVPLEEIDSAPSIDIVHCFECKYGEYREDYDDYLCKDDGLSVHDADFYCADGERKNDAD